MILENFKNHSVFEKLDQLQNALNNENAETSIGIENFTFFKTVHQYIIDKLRITIPILITDAELLSIATEIEAGTSQINTFYGNKNTGHISNAINNFHSALSRVRNLPFAISKNDFNFSKAISSFQSTIESAYQKLKDNNKEIQEELLKTQQGLSNQNTKLQDFERQIVAKEAEIQNVMATYNNEFETIKVKNSNIFEAEQKRFNEEILLDRKSFKEQLNTDIEANSKIFENQKTELKEASDLIINNLNTKLEEAKKIVNIVGNVGVTGNYQKIANQNNKSANFFRWIALGFMILMSALLIWSILDLSSGEFNLYKSLVRILAAAVLTYPAVYAAKESNKHRNLETKNRNLELELASIGPFIELLPDDKKQQIKEELVAKYFGKNVSYNDEKNDNEDISINALEKIVKAILPFIKK